VSNVKTVGLTANVPMRLRIGAIVVVCAIFGAGIDIFLGFYDNEYRWVAWLGISGLILMLVASYALVLQIVAYRNPALQLTEHALVFYGTSIPWTAITDVGVGPTYFSSRVRTRSSILLNDNRVWILIPGWTDLTWPKLIYYFSIKSSMPRTGGKLSLPRVKERSAEQLASDIRAYI
jgi:hypothetical protein